MNCVYCFPLIAWNDDDFPVGKKTEMLAIKASPEYMGNPAGEGAIWQRTPSGVEVKVRLSECEYRFVY